MNNTRKMGWLLTAGLVGAALVAPVGASAVSVDWATITGYADGSSDNNKPETWGPNCTKLDSPGVSTFVLDKDYALVVVKAGSDQSADAPNTLFENASAGETVWADSNKSGVYDEGDKGISHIIFCGPSEESSASVPVESESVPVESESVPVESESVPVESESVPVESSTPEGSVPVESSTPEGSVEAETGTPEGSVEAETGTPVGSVEAATGTPEEELTLPPTDSITSSNTASSSGWQLVLVALAAILATALIVTPASRKSRR